jgi:hypothetical protein
MIINGKDYKLCLFDTCALTSFLQNQNYWITKFEQEFGLSNAVVCYSAFTLSELWYRQEIFEKFIDFFSWYPSLLLEGHQSILDKEVIAYNTNTDINPVSICPSAITDEKLTKRERLKKVIEDSEFVARTAYWKEAEESILKSITGYTKSYPPKNNKYSINEISNFVDIVSANQLYLREKQFVKKHKEPIDFTKFPSLLTTSYIVFYKFYLDQRKHINSDIFDIIISSVLPYVDYFITEKNLANNIKSIQTRHKYLTNVKAFTLAEYTQDIKKHRTTSST